jgi:hypothetical protein
VGGTILDGKYYLSTYTVYGPIEAGTGDAGAEITHGTLGFSGGEIFHALLVKGVYTTRVGTFVTSGATLSTLTMVCDSDGGADSLNYGYTVAGQDIVTRLSPDPVVITWTRSN